MKWSRFFGPAATGLLLLLPVASLAAPEEHGKETCPHPEGWKPTEEELQRSLSDHKQWLTDHEEVLENWDSAMRANNQQWKEAMMASGRMNLCNARLPFKLNEADLRWAKLNKADLTGAELNNANLLRAELNNASLVGARLNNAVLAAAKLNNADLGFAKLNNARLLGAELNNARLLGAELNNADLVGAELNNANLVVAEIADAQLSYADLTGARYAPQSGQPNAYVGIKGLKSVNFPKGEEVGLVQLRELLQKAGLRNSEREATFAIESGRTAHALAAWRENLAGAAEGVVRKAAFEWTTGYGLYPRRAIEISAALWAGMILVYFWPIRLKQRTPQGAGIYQVWPSGRIETSERGVSLSKSDETNLLQSSNTLGAIGYAAYFSLLSTFNIGWRDLNVGTWIARTQPREYALRATGWLRVVSGIQSLLSVYLLAIWVLTYFGRPFQ
jgi:hypothetical protein